MQSVTKRVLLLFLLVFTASHVATAAKGTSEGNRYFVSLSFWTLLLTALASTTSATPPYVVAAALAANVLVCGLYYNVINRGAVSGQQFLLHGGCALVLLAFASAEELSVTCAPWKAAVAALAFFLANAAAQRWFEEATKKPVYPESKFTSPLWRFALVPALGAGLAAALSWPR